MSTLLKKYLVFSLLLFLPSNVFASLGVIAEISLPGPYAARYNPANKLTYISYRHGIAVFNGTEMIHSIPLKGWVMAVNSKNGYVYVISPDFPILGLLHLIQGTEVIKRVGYVGVLPAAFAVNPETGYFYVAHTFFPSQTGWVPLHTQFLQTVKDDELSVKVRVGKAAYDMAVEPTTSYLYIVNYFDSSVSIVQEASNIGTIMLQGLPSPERIAVNPNNGRVYVTAGNQIAIIEGKELIATTHPDTEHYNYIVAEPNSGYVYATKGIDKLSVFDGIDLLDYFDFSPYNTILGLAVNPNSGLIYVLVTMRLVVIQGIDIITEVPVGTIGEDSYHLAAVDPDRGFVYFTNEGNDKVKIVGETE